MSEMTVPTPGPQSKLSEADLQAEIRALQALVGQLLQATAPAQEGFDLRTAKITPDELLDAWVAARGPKAEAYLLNRIFRRRAARHVARV